MFIPIQDWGMHNDKRSPPASFAEIDHFGVEIQCKNQDWSPEASEKNQIEVFYRGIILIRLGETEITKEHDLAQ